LLLFSVNGRRLMSSGPVRVSDQLEGWFHADQPHTLGSLIALFGEKSFAVVFIVLMAVPALPLPTGGVTHVLEVAIMLLALELIVGRLTIWLPDRWKQLELAGASRERFTSALVKRIRWFERFSRPRLRPLLRQRSSHVVFGVVVFTLALTAFVAPPFSGLDTLPALGVVVVGPRSAARGLRSGRRGLGHRSRRCAACNCARQSRRPLASPAGIGPSHRFGFPREVRHVSGH
jgi:hypothetical protein